MGSQTLKLKWAGHTSNMTTELQELYLSGALFDVTIACGEFSLKAHKTVLSASSTFFRKLFIENPCKHPILIMTDIDFEDLKSIVEFMYQGEIHIYQEQLAQFLKIAERLKIKGLTNIENMNLIPYDSGIGDSHFSDSAWGHISTQPALQDTTETENAHNNARKLTDCIETQSSESSEKPQTVKLEEDSSQPNNSCMYWKNECFDQTPSSLLPECILSRPTAVSHQLEATSVSHQLPTPSISQEQSKSTPPATHEFSTLSSASQMSPSSVSHELLHPPVSHQFGVPLNSEAFTYTESQTKSRTSAHVQHENTGKDIVTYTETQTSSETSTEHNKSIEEDTCMYTESHTNSGASTQTPDENAGKAIDSGSVCHSQDKPSVVIPSGADSSEIIHSLNNQPLSEDGKTDGNGEATNKVDQNHTDVSRDSALSSMDSDRSSSEDEDGVDYTPQDASFAGDDVGICSPLSTSPSLHSLSYSSSGSASCSDQSPAPKKLRKLFRKKGFHFHDKKNNEDSDDDDKRENHQEQSQEPIQLKFEEHNSMDENYESDLKVNPHISEKALDFDENYELSTKEDLSAATSINENVHYYYSYNIPFGSKYDCKPFFRNKYRDLEESRRDERRAKELKIPISNHDIVNLPLEEFNEKLSKYDLNETQLQLIRDIRRRGKNKVAAQNCRKRKLFHIMTLQEDLKLLIDERNTLRAEQETIRSCKHHITNKYNQLYNLIKESSSGPPLLILPDTLHQPTLNAGGDSSIPLNSISLNGSDNSSSGKDDISK